MVLPKRPAIRHFTSRHNATSARWGSSIDTSSVLNDFPSSGRYSLDFAVLVDSDSGNSNGIESDLVATDLQSLLDWIAQRIMLA